MREIQPVMQVFPGGSPAGRPKGGSCPGGMGISSGAIDRVFFHGYSLHQQLGSTI